MLMLLMLLLKKDASGSLGGHLFEEDSLGIGSGDADGWMDPGRLLHSQHIGPLSSEPWSGPHHAVGGGQHRCRREWRPDDPG